jgi:hypothetical protein
MVSLTAALIADSGVLRKLRDTGMVWTDTTRAQHARDELALPSDMTDAE